MGWGGGVGGDIKPDSQLQARCLYSQSRQVAGEERAKGKRGNKKRVRGGRELYGGTVGWMDG